MIYGFYFKTNKKIVLIQKYIRFSVHRVLQLNFLQKITSMYPLRKRPTSRTPIQIFWNYSNFSNRTFVVNIMQETQLS